MRRLKWRLCMVKWSTLKIFRFRKREPVFILSTPNTWINCTCSRRSPLVSHTVLVVVPCTNDILSDSAYSVHVGAINRKLRVLFQVQKFFGIQYRTVPEIKIYVYSVSIHFADCKSFVIYAIISPPRVLPEYLTVNAKRIWYNFAQTVGFAYLMCQWCTFIAFWLHAMNENELLCLQLKPLLRKYDDIYYMLPNQSTRI